jgi:hypothetical protein
MSDKNATAVQIRKETKWHARAKNRNAIEIWAGLKL